MIERTQQLLARSPPLKPRISEAQGQSGPERNTGETSRIRLIPANRVDRDLDAVTATINVLKNRVERQTA